MNSNVRAHVSGTQNFNVRIHTGGPQSTDVKVDEGQAGPFRTNVEETSPPTHTIAQ